MAIWEQLAKVFMISTTMKKMPMMPRKTLLCRATKAAVFSSASFAFFAVFTVVCAVFWTDFAPFPALAAAYSFLMDCFCCHRDACAGKGSSAGP
jgi:thiamine transporter ThiT